MIFQTSLIKNTSSYAPMFKKVWMFTSYTPPHRCRVPICDGADNFSLVNASFVSFAVPMEHNAKEFVTDGSHFDPCSVYKPIDPLGGCTPENFNTTNKTICDEFVYDYSIYAETLTTKLNLVCGKQYKQRLFGTFTMAGLLIGKLTFALKALKT
jgi:hypothetical protein